MKIQSLELRRLKVRSFVTHLEGQHIAKIYGAADDGSGTGTLDGESCVDGIPTDNCGQTQECGSGGVRESAMCQH